MAGNPPAAATRPNDGDLTVTAPGSEASSSLLDGLRADCCCCAGGGGELGNASEIWEVLLSSSSLPRALRRCFCINLASWGSILERTGERTRRR